MPRDPQNPAKPGEHSVKGSSAGSVKPAKGKKIDDDDDARTERFPEYSDALDVSEKQFRQGSGEF